MSIFRISKCMIRIRDICDGGSVDYVFFFALPTVPYGLNEFGVCVCVLD